MIRNRISRPQSDRLVQAFRFRAARRRGRFHLSLGRGSLTLVLIWLVVLVLGTLAFLRTGWRSAAVATAPREPGGATIADAAAKVPVVLEVSAKPPDNAITPRIAGLNYLVLGSFARHEDAKAFQHRVASLGILASIEPALAGWSRSGFCVVDERGFELPRQQRELERAITQLKTARIDAKPYRWRGESVADAR
jgi:hypothetical protein